MIAKGSGKKRYALINGTNKTRAVTESEAYKNRARKRPQDFSEDRKMIFSEMMCFMLNQVKTSTQTALDHFFDLIGKSDIHTFQI